MKISKSYLSLVAVGFLSGLASVSVTGCDKVEDLAEQCDLTCPAEGILEGNASISGIPSVDSFFAATIDVRNATLELESSLRTELLALAAALGVENPSNNVKDLGNQVRDALKAQFSAKLEGGVTIGYAPPKCEADLEVAVKASAQCDVEASPGKADFSCSGSCDIEASVEAQAQCEASGTLRCEVTAPAIKCEGTCAGTCQLEVAAECSGTCSGTCEGNCSACVGGECKTDGNGVITNCAGTCSGSCQGSCEMSAGASCSGKCEGTCEYTAPKGGCEANASVRCEAKAGVDMKVDCKGQCQGTIEPPKMKAECQASVDAKARADLKCTPPQLDIDYNFKASIGAEGKAEFRALLNVLRIRFAAILALESKAQAVVEASTALVNNTGSMIDGVKARIEAEVSVKSIRNISCAVSEAKHVATMMQQSGSTLEASIGAAASVKGSMSTYTYDR